MRQEHERLRAMFAGIESGYDTHRPVLCEALIRTNGPILELGVGEGSTPALHIVACKFGRRLFSFDKDPEWISRYRRLRSPEHMVALVPTWDDCPVESEFWSVAFVDHAPADRRPIEVARLAFKAEVIVLHDTEEPEYGYGTILDSFESRRDHRRYKQWTSVLSNFTDVRGWSIPDDW